MAEASAITKGSCVFILTVKWTDELLLLKTSRILLNTHSLSSDPQKLTRLDKMNNERLAFSTTYHGLHKSIKRCKEVITQCAGNKVFSNYHPEWSFGEQIVKNENSCILKHFRSLRLWLEAFLGSISQHGQTSAVNDGLSSLCDCGTKGRKTQWLHWFNAETSALPLRGFSSIHCWNNQLITLT